MKKVLVGMSGGIDSSATILKLMDEGFEVGGLSILFYPSPSSSPFQKVQEFCDAYDIRHYIINATELFQTRVLNYFMSGYLNGTTPFPCAICNPK